MKALIVGLGISGVSSARFLKNSGHEIFIYDDNAAQLERYSSEYQVYDENLKYDLAIISPGVPATHGVIQKLTGQGTEIIGELELAGRFVKDEKVIAVTGTNGKSTTVSLIHAFLKNAGFKSFLCGNIGEPVINGIGNGYEFFVIELSSFQLETLKSLKVDVAMVLNVTPDHLDRYKDFEDYKNTKLNLLNLLKKGGTAVLGTGIVADDFKHPGFDLKLFSVEGTEDISCDDEFVYFDGKKLKVDDLKIRGHHNVENIMASVLGVKKWVSDTEILRRALLEFNPLAHRTAFVDKFQGVEFIDDSKGTNVGAVEKSLAGFDDGKVVLILGGVDKGGSYEPVRILADRKCKGVVLIGASKEIIRPYFNGFANVESADSMAEAVEKAFLLAKKDGVVLFSPACSSFDWYKNYKERGDDFVNKVKDLKSKIEG
ncbi:UDP-N-acetylmuramoyl-L-alanine--D-glutamate ligase [bacterium]|nr:UDP-N-acetylmuramoyl-L-alanine--D-glutamate ligase [bacterium]